MTANPSTAGQATLAEIRESEARGAIAALYRDIRATQRGSNVNYIWRHLATIPDALGIAWAASRKREEAIHAFGEVIWSYAGALVAREPGPRSDASRLLDQAVLETYAGGNRWNLAAVSTLLGRPLPSTQPTLAAERENLAPIPPIPRFEDLPIELRATVDMLAAAGPAADTPIRPSLWIHLALFPDCLLALAPRLAAMLGSAAFAAAHRSLLDLCTRGAEASLPELPAAAGTSLRLFQRRIAEMTLVCAALAARGDTLPIKNRNFKLPFS